MILSSLRRLRLYLGSDSGSLFTDNLRNNAALLNWLTMASDEIEQFLGRTILIASRTEYFDVKYMQTEYYPAAVPIITITSVKADRQGLFTGAESTLSSDSDYHLGTNSKSIVLNYPLMWEFPRTLQIVYTGGMAYHSVNNTWILSGAPAATPTVGRFVKGTTSGAIGIVVSYTVATLTLVVESYYGVFESGETITEYSDEDGTAGANALTTISSISKQSLVEAYPSIVLACEAHVRYMLRHALDFENTGTTKDGTSIRSRGAGGLARPFIDEVYNMLVPFRRYI